jgi:hypothetical protein
MLGYADKSGAWRAIHRLQERWRLAKQMQEPIPTLEEKALQAAILDYEADLAEAEADKLAERKRKKREAGQRKRAKTLQAKRMAQARR